jgi:hypothetical protein
LSSRTPKQSTRASNPTFTEDLVTRNVKVFESVPAPKHDYPQHLKEPSAERSGLKITWQQIFPLLASNPNQPAMGTSNIIMIYDGGKLVPKKYNQTTINSKFNTMRLIMDQFANHKMTDDATPIFQRAGELMLFLE